MRTADGWDLPPGWVTTHIEDLLEPLEDGRTLHQGWSPQCEKAARKTDKHWGVLKTTAIQAGTFLPEHNKRLPTHLLPRPLIEVRDGDLLITSAGPRARCGIVCLVRSATPHLMISGKMYRFRVSKRHVDARFVESYLQSARAQDAIERMKTGISDSGLNLTQERFRRLTVPVAPLAEQHRIVAAIEEQLSRIDAAEVSLRRVARRVAVLRQSVLDQCGIVDDRLVGPLAHGLREPLVNGRSVPTREGGFPVLRLTALRQGLVDVREAKPGAWASADAEPFLVEAGDFLVARGNGSRHLVGRGGLVQESPPPVAFPDTVIRIRVDEGLLRRRYLRLVWDSRVVREQIESQARTTAGIYKINQEILRSIRVPFPPVERQDRLVLNAEHNLSVLDALAARVTVALMQSKVLRRSILAQAFTGRLVPQDPADEPASMLLERIAALRESEPKVSRKRRTVPA